MTVEPAAGAHPDGAPGQPALPPVDVPFSEPWQARIFAAAVLTCEGMGLPWDAFRDQLKAAVAEDPQRPYYESVTLALERLTSS